MKKQVQCERFDEPAKKKSSPLTVPIVCVVLGCMAVFWTYNHVSGNCLEFADVFSYCEFHQSR